MALEISDRHSATELRTMARRETNGRVASRMLAIANALDGLSRADAARAASDMKIRCGVSRPAFARRYNQ